MPEISRQRRLEEFKAFLDGITADGLDEHELDLFLAWSGLPWYAVQLPQAKQFAEYVVQAVKQYKQFVETASQREKQASEVVSSSEITSLTSSLEASYQVLESGDSQPNFDEQGTVLIKELILQLQKALIQAERWQRNVEASNDKVLFGELHSYRKDGKVRWNYYPNEAGDNPKRKDKRRYVRQKEVEIYRRAILLGKKLKQIQALKQKLPTLLDKLRSLL
ncbi:MAG: hypothetical protein KME42_05785 [Tildeniella nuda ZEHNDER 1965/U140]|nr:hypothetical protein [Tildeniella nuda ZEHNDER 1965/U140]